MIKLKDFKKAYMALKVDYLNVCSDVDYYVKVKANPAHEDYEYVKDNYDRLKMDERVAYHRLATFTECVLEMHTSATYDVPVIQNGIKREVRAAIDFTFDDDYRRGCYCVKLNVCVFRDYEFYKQLLSDSHKDVLEDIDIVFDQNDHGMMNLYELQREIIDIANDGKNYYPCSICSDETTISEDFFLECGFKALEDYIKNRAVDAANDFIKHLNELELEH